MTAYALAGDKARPAGLKVKFDGLMTAVHARDIASAAAVAELIIEYREQYGVSFDAVVVDYRAGCTSYEILLLPYGILLPLSICFSYSFFMMGNV